MRRTLWLRFAEFFDSKRRPLRRALFTIKGHTKGSLLYEFYWNAPGEDPPEGEREYFEMQKTQNLQDLFLNQARRERQIVTVFLMNGFQMRGIVRGFDSFTVVLETDGKQQLIYKHAISTLVPARNVDMSSGPAAT